MDYNFYPREHGLGAGEGKGRKQAEGAGESCQLEAEVHEETQHLGRGDRQQKIKSIGSILEGKQKPIARLRQRREDEEYRACQTAKYF